jgi:hypothetical protein
LLVGFNACDDEEPIPGYVYIPSMNLSVNSNGSEGSDAHNIEDAWVYAGGEFIGVFQLPTRVPILKSGEQEITIIAGIRKNGLANERVAYPFYNPHIETVNLVPSEIDTIIPSLSYRDNVIFPWLEDFEDQSVSLERSGSTTSIDSLRITGNANLVYNYDGVKNRFSGEVVLDTGFQIFENSSVQIFDLPRSGREIYLEINYKTDAELDVGLYPISGSVVNGVSVVRFYPTTEWKKAYISLKEDVNNAEYLGFDFKVFLHSQTNSESIIPKIYIDNIKLVQFES